MELPAKAAAISEAGVDEKRRGWPRRERRLQQWPQEGAQYGEEEGAGAERPPCVFCSQSKVKCVGGLPCERCWVLNLPCRLRQRQRRMPKGKRRQGEDADAARELLAAAMGGPPVAVVLATANVKANAEAYLQAFHQLLSEGQVIRERVISHLRYWRKMALVMGADVTWGIVDSLTAALHVTPTELEEPEALAASPPPQIRKRQAAAILASTRMRVARLKQDPAFKAEDDGVTPIYLNMTGEDGCGLFVNNDAFDRVMGRSALEQLEMARQRRAVMILLTASTICPEDRPTAFYQGLAVKFTPLKRATAVFKMFVNGEVKLFLMHAKRVMVDGLSGTLITYEPAPTSRYLTDRPDLPHVVRSFKQYGHGGHEGTAAAPSTTSAASASTAPGPGALGAAATTRAGAVDAPVDPAIPLPLPAFAAVPMLPRPPGAAGAAGAAGAEGPPVDLPRCEELFGLANPNPMPCARTDSTGSLSGSGDCDSSSGDGSGDSGGGSGGGASDSVATVALAWEDGVGVEAAEAAEAAEFVADVPLLDMWEGGVGGGEGLLEAAEVAELVGNVPIFDAELIQSLFD